MHCSISRARKMEWKGNTGLLIADPKSFVCRSHPSFSQIPLLSFILPTLTAIMYLGFHPYRLYVGIIGGIGLLTVKTIHFIGTRYGKRPIVRGGGSAAEELKKDMSHREWQNLQEEWNS